MHNNNVSLRNHWEKYSSGVACLANHGPFSLQFISYYFTLFKRDVNKAFDREVKSIEELDMALKYPAFMNSKDQNPQNKHAQVGHCWPSGPL